MAKKRTVNWNKIKTEYITTDISQRNLAKKYKISYSTLRDHSKADEDDWYKLKCQYRTDVVADAVKQSATEEAALLAAEYDIADKFVKLIEESLDDDTYLSSISDGINTKKVLEAANALSRFIDIKRLIKGHQSIQEKQAYELAVRRLQLEENKAKENNETDKEIKIVLGDGVEEFVV